MLLYIYCVFTVYLRYWGFDQITIFNLNNNASLFLYDYNDLLLNVSFFKIIDQLFQQMHRAVNSQQGGIDAKIIVICPSPLS